MALMSTATAKEGTKLFYRDWGTRVHFIQPLKERLVRELGYGLSLEGASAADLVKSKK
jgi:hypothetical protein